MLKSEKSSGTTTADSEPAAATVAATPEIKTFCRIFIVMMFWCYFGVKVGDVVGLESFPRRD
jgi:hypothetical protein